MPPVSCTLFYITNGEHLLESPRFFQILQNALGSLSAHGHAPTVLLKSLFFFPRGRTSCKGILAAWIIEGLCENCPYCPQPTCERFRVIE